MGVGILSIVARFGVDIARSVPRPCLPQLTRLQVTVDMLIGCPLCSIDQSLPNYLVFVLKTLPAPPSLHLWVHHVRGHVPVHILRDATNDVCLRRSLRLSMENSCLFPPSPLICIRASPYRSLAGSVLAWRSSVSSLTSSSDCPADNDSDYPL